MDDLNIEIMTSDSLVESPEHEDRDSRETLAKLVLKDLQETEGGRRYLEYFFRHNEEIRRLINANKRVAVAWQRNHGPQLFQSLILTVQDTTARLPHDIEGRTLASCIDGILDAILTYGSTELQRDIVREAPDVSVLSGLSYKQLLEYLDTLDHELVG
jgi:tRNA A37 N6-isopentenylltransferase MiaA